MSFWSGVVQGVKDIDVLKEKEALTEERQAVRDEENAYREQMRVYNETRDVKADARLAAQDVILADQNKYDRDQDKIAKAERDAAVEESARRFDSEFNWGREVFWIGQDRTDESIALDMMKWDYGVLRDKTQDEIAALDRETDQERYAFQVERLGQLDAINAAAVVEDGRRYGQAQERLELLDLREEARIAKDDDRYAVAQARIDRLDAQNVVKDLDINNFNGGSSVGSSPTKPGPSGGTSSSSLNHELSRAYRLGATDDSLAALLGHNQSAAAVAATVDLYTAYAEKQSGMPGSAMSFDEYLQQTNVILTPAAEVTIEMVEAAAKKIGVNTEDIYSGNLTYGEMISARLKQTAGSGQLSVTGPNAPKPMDLGEVTSTMAAADQNMAAMVEQTIAELSVMYEGATDDTDEKRRLAERLAQAEQDLKDFNKGIGTAKVIDKYGANAILSIIANNPDALGRNDFAKYTTAIKNRTYNSEAEVLGAYRRNALLDGDKYVINNVIFSADGEALESASRGPESSPRPRARPDTMLGAQVGVMPAEPGTYTEADTSFSDFDPTAFTFDTMDQANSYMGSLSTSDRAKVPYITVGGKRALNSAYVNLDSPPAGLGGDGSYVSTPSIGDPSISQPPGSLDIEQTLIPSEALQTTVSTGDTRPTNQGIGDLAKPSALDSVTSAYVTAKGEPLSQEEELSIGIEAIVDGLIGDKTDQAELDSLIRELQEKFGDEKVREALSLAMNLQQ